MVFAYEKRRNHFQVCQRELIFPGQKYYVGVTKNTATLSLIEAENKLYIY